MKYLIAVLLVAQIGFFIETMRRIIVQAKKEGCKYHV